MRTRTLVLVAAFGITSLASIPAAAADPPSKTPSIHSFSPSSGPVGTSVVVHGNWFTNVSSVTFNNVSATNFTVNSKTQITAIVPAGGSGLIRVTAQGGTATSSSNFTVTALTTPTITSFSPKSGPVGTSVVISGTSLTGANPVTFNLVPATTFTVNSATKITAIVPLNATTGPIRVTTGLGTATSATNFTVTTGTTGGNGATGGRPLSAGLSGGAEVPGPGDPDGKGTAVIRVNPGLRKVCFDLSVSGITLPATAAHIHTGKAGVAGPVLITLTPPGANGKSSGCVRDLNRGTLVDMIQKPGNYYVNVHTTDFPNGAIRGQLGKGFAPTGGTTISTTLTGAAEFPGPGDPDGTGSAKITLDPSAGTICYSLTVAGITLPSTAASINQGAPGVAGPVVASLAAPGVTGTSSGCLTGMATLASAIKASPASYYVNVLTTDFPAGAIRGQL